MPEHRGRGLAFTLTNRTCLASALGTAQDKRNMVGLAEYRNLAAEPGESF